MPTKRKFTATFPTAKIKKIMQLDEEIGKISATVPSVVSCGVETFIKQIVREAYQLASTRNSRTVTVSHIKHVVMSHPEFSFAHSMVENIADLKPQNPVSSRNTNDTTKLNDECDLENLESNHKSDSNRKRGRPRKEQNHDTCNVKKGKKKKSENAEIPCENNSNGSVEPISTT